MVRKSEKCQRETSTSCPMIGGGPSSRPEGRNRLRSMTPSERRSTGLGASPETRDPSCLSTGGMGPSASATRMETTHFRREGNRACDFQAADRRVALLVSRSAAVSPIRARCHSRSRQKLETAFWSIPWSGFLESDRFRRSADESHNGPTARCAGRNSRSCRHRRTPEAFVQISPLHEQ